jgi:cysteine synthase
MTESEKENRKWKSSLMEGIGSSKVYGNLSHSSIDDSFIITDVAAINMCHFLVNKEKE